MPGVQRLRWYAARAGAMSPAEVAWRARRAAEAAAPWPVPDPVTAPADWAAAYRDFRAAVGRPVLLDRERAAAIAAAYPEQAAAVVAAADEALDGRFGYFGDPAVRFPDGVVDWNLDPRTGQRWPDRPAARIDHRTVDADPKWIWELNRLQHLPWLAQAWLFTGAERYAEGALAQLDSWIAQNPPGQGIAWRGGFEAGIRAISVAVALQGLRDAPALTEERYRAAATLLATGASLAWRERSRFSSANNHLVGELAGVATTALLHPELTGAVRIGARAVQALCAEAGRQILPDGVGAEQAAVYQMFTAELLLVPAVLLARRTGSPPGPLVSAVRRGAEFLRAVGEPTWRAGDDDGGLALRLLPDPVPALGRHLAVADALTRSVAGDLASAWLVPPGAAVEPAPPAPAAEPRDLYARDGGLVVLRRGGRRLTMDVGPLGYLSIAAHGHADALAVTVAVDGRDVLGDPGTGSYYAEPAVRAAFRGTRAHGTAAVDDLDQSVPGGPFLWVRHAATTVRAVDLDRGLVEAEHDGYTRLAEPVRHRRYLLAPPGAAAALVVDLFTGAGAHRLRTAWPVHPDLEVRDGDGRHVVADPATGEDVLAVAAAATGAAEPWSVRGDEGSRLGWWSHRFESRTPAWLVGTLVPAAALPLAVATVLGPGAAAPRISRNGDHLRVWWNEGTTRYDVSIDTGVMGAVSLRRDAPEEEKV